MTPTPFVLDPVELAARIRYHTIQMTHRAKASHVGSSLSMADLLAVLYSRILRVDPGAPRSSDRDRLIVSKGHGSAAVYAVLAERGFFPVEQLETFYQNGSHLAGHVETGVPGVELSTGSLGHGLPVGTGMALAAKRDGRDYRVFVILSDGELDEGSNWEALLFGPQHRLDNLTVIIDFNKIQSFGTVKEVLDLDPLPEKLRAFNWAVREVDGHDPAALEELLRGLPFEPGRPNCVVAHTVKGKGVSFMENELLWHYRTPQGDEYRAAMAELGCSA